MMLVRIPPVIPNSHSVIVTRVIPRHCERPTTRVTLKLTSFFGFCAKIRLAESAGCGFSCRNPEFPRCNLAYCCDLGIRLPEMLTTFA